MRAVVAVVSVAVAIVSAEPSDPFKLDRDATRWVDDTLKKLTVDEKVGQLIVPSFESGYISTDSDAFDELARLTRDFHVGGFHVFGASQPAPSVLLNPAYGTVILGQPFSAAFITNRLQRLATVPLLNTADFETGVGFRIFGATSFPRQMAMGAANDERLVREEARITGLEARALGVHVNFAPVADVNNNPRNPVINTRSYGEDPARVGALVGAFIDGAREGGMIATLKHFPGHGDTDVDSHLGLPVVTFDRGRLNTLELVPFRKGLDQRRRSGHGRAHRPAGARQRVDAGDLQQADGDRPPARRTRVWRPGVHRFDVHGRHYEAGVAGRGGRSRRGRRSRSGAAFARSRRGVPGDPEARCRAGASARPSSTPP